MVLERIRSEKDTSWIADKRIEKIPSSYHGEKRLATGEVESTSISSDNILIEMRRQSNPEREDGLVGDNYTMIPDLDVYAVFDGVSLSSSDSTSAYGASKLLEKKWQQYANKELENLSLEKIHDLMLKIVQEVQTRLCEINKIESSNFLSTCSMVKIHQGYCLVVSVGDSPVFLQTDQGIEQITIAHDKIREGTKDKNGKRLSSNIDEFVSTDFHFDKKELQIKQKNPGIIRNNPTSFLGRKEGFVVDFYVRQLKKGDRILLASDGAMKKNSNLSLDTEDNLSNMANSLVEDFSSDDDATILLLGN